VSESGHYVLLKVSPLVRLVDFYVQALANLNTVTLAELYNLLFQQLKNFILFFSLQPVFHDRLKFVYF